MAKSQKVEEDSTEKTKESTTARAANTARWRNRQAEKDANIIAAYNKHREKMNLPSISLHFRHSVPFKGGARPNYMPPDDQMKTMTEKELSEWRSQERKKRKAAKQRENRAKKKARMQMIKATMGVTEVLHDGTVITPDVQVSTGTAINFPDVQTSTGTAINLPPNVQTSTGTATIFPDVQTSTATAIHFPDVQTSTGTAIHFPDVQTSTGMAIHLPDVQTSMKKNSELQVPHLPEVKLPHMKMAGFEDFAFEIDDFSVDINETLETDCSKFDFDDISLTKPNIEFSHNDIGFDDASAAGSAILKELIGTPKTTEDEESSNDWGDLDTFKDEVFKGFNSPPHEMFKDEEYIAMFGKHKDSD